VLCGFCKAIGCEREKTRIESSEEISFFLDINIEVNERERLWDSKFKTKKWDQVSLDHVRRVFVLPS
jgi:hypothetical protein